MAYRVLPLTARPGAAGVLGILVCVLLGASCAAPEPPAPTPVELGRMEAMSEGFANLLLDLGAALAATPRGDVERFFEPRLTGRPFPSAAGSMEPVREGVARRIWRVDGERAALGREELVASLDVFLARFSTVEAVDFEVPMTEVRSPAELDARVDLSVVARDHEGRREWVRGSARAAAHVGEDHAPRITAFAVESLTSLVAERELFRDVTAAAGVAAEDPSLAEAMARLEHWYPNGAAAADVDRDGLVDLFVTGPRSNRLYRNRGDGSFDDVADAAGLGRMLADKPEFVPFFFDYDNDGDADLFATALHENALYENRLVPDGLLVFRDRSLGLPSFPEVQGWSVAAADVDGDGDVDLYVPSYASATGGPVARTTIWDQDGRPNLLFINQGDGAGGPVTFTEEGEARGVADRRFGLAAQFADVDGDFDPDLYLANDYGGGNCLYVNRGGRFTDEAAARGVLHAAQSMGVSFSDYDGDGDLDLHVTNMSSTAAARAFARYDGAPLKHREHLARQWSGHALFANRGDGTFRDVSAEAGPFRGGWGWGGGFVDLDNDGWEDLHVPNGFFSGERPHDLRSPVFATAIIATQGERVEEMMGHAMGEMVRMLVERGMSFAGHERDFVALNDGHGRFLDVSGLSGADSPSDGRAAVYADFDNDGDHDVFLRATHGRAHFLFRNQAGQDKGFLRVALEGRASGRDAFGAVVRVRTASRTLTRAKRASNGYLAQPDPRLLFGLGDETAAEEIEVRWPSARVERFPGPFASGSSLRIVEGGGAPATVRETRFRLGPDGG